MPSVRSIGLLCAVWRPWCVARDPASPCRPIDIPLGEVHRLENAEDEPLHVIEVQTGDYLGEDDIQRFEDVYGRAEAT